MFRPPLGYELKNKNNLPRMHTEGYFVEYRICYDWLRNAYQTERCVVHARAPFYDIFDGFADKILSKWT